MGKPEIKGVLVVVKLGENTISKLGVIMMNKKKSVFTKDGAEIGDCQRKINMTSTFNIDSEGGM